MRIKHILAGIALLLILIPIPSIAPADQALDISMEDLARCELAFRGRLVKAEASLLYKEGFKGGMAVTNYTFDVSDVLKGDVPKTFSFTQAGASQVDSKKLGKPFIYGAPTYVVGKEYVLFLTKENKLGLRAPVGLKSGKFQVTVMPDGKAMVANEFSNKAVFKNLPQTKAMTKALSTGGIKSGAQPTTGPVDYDAFKAVFEGLEEKE